MTSTPFSIGLSDDTRLSSRVLRPPGGGHTDIFGSEPEPPRVGRRPGPNTAVAPPPPKVEETPKATNGASEAAVNGGSTPEAPPQAPASSPAEAPQPEAPREAPKEQPLKAEPPRAEAPKRVRVPPGGLLFGPLIYCQGTPPSCGNSLPDPKSDLKGLSQKITSEPATSRMQGMPSVLVQQRGDECSTDSAGFTSANEEEELESAATSPVASASTSPPPDDSFPANIDLRYGGQYLTPEQLPEFCNQLHHLVEVIRNIQSYAKVTGEYPSELEKRLEREAREVASLAGEARAARDVLLRTRTQRRALHATRTHLSAQLATLRHTEIRELESVVRVSDRKLYKSWEAIKDSTDPAAFQPLIDEIKTKQTALECLQRLVAQRRRALPPRAPHPHPLPPPQPRDDHESTTVMGSVRKRHDMSRRVTHKRRKRDTTREPRSVPLSGESSRHGTTVQVTVGQPSLELTTRASVRDILFFTSN